PDGSSTLPEPLIRAARTAMDQQKVGALVVMGGDGSLRTGLHLSRAGLRDVVIDGENGWLLPSDATAWASVLDAAAANPQDLARRKAESLRIAGRFDLIKITEQYERVLQRAAGKSVAEK
ncbi:MAG: hypothetical protein ACKOKC_09775, partial [Chthoniobacterales bacterium]